MRRRDLIKLLGGAAAWPVMVQGQQVVGPRIGLLRTTTAAPFAYVAEALREGLGEEGFVHGHNISLDQRWADNRLDRLPMLATELVSLPVAAIVCNSLAVSAAKAATSAIPIVFVSGDDPVKA